MCNKVRVATARSRALFFEYSGVHRVLHSFPTRRSSDLGQRQPAGLVGRRPVSCLHGSGRQGKPPVVGAPDVGDRKSTRLNSSHTVISYAVFCLKKKSDERETEVRS